MSSEDQCECELEQKKVTKKTKDEKIKDLMQKSIYDKKVEIPKDTLKSKEVIDMETVDKIRAPVAKCSNIQPFKLEDMDIEKVLVEYKIRRPKPEKVEKKDKKDETNKKEEKISLCDAFRLAGFQQDWTKEKVENMLKSEDGRMILERVDREFKRLTGKKTITESDILSCFPNYLKRSKNIQLSIKIDE